MTDSVSIIGDGQMALVMADALAERGLNVRIWGPFERDVQHLFTQRRSPRLPELTLPLSVQLTTDDAQSMAGSSTVISAIPTQFLRQVWERLVPFIPHNACIVSVTKGIENETLLRPTQVIEDVLAKSCSASNRVRPGQIRSCALSGPSIAAELARRMPASLVAASADSPCAVRIQDFLRVPWLRVYRNDDVIGVEIAGATKNVIALAAGMIDGLDAGANAKSALLARGLAEIARLGVAMGARIDTFFGVAGVGDLATTCFSPEGRNRTCGERLARGESLDGILGSTASVIEGVATTRSVVALAQLHRVDMPITRAVNSILFEGLSPRDAIRELMSRELKTEQVG